MKYEFNFSVDGWLFTEVDGKSYEDCEEQLLRMPLEELISAGYVKDFAIKDVDARLLEKTYNIKVTSIEYAIEEEDLPDAMTKEELLEELPQQLTFSIDMETDDIEDLEERIADEISDETGWLVSHFTYKIISEE